jgi:phage baseplate assembly protein W
MMATAAQNIAFPFAVAPGSRRLAETGDHDAYVRGLIRQVLLTAQGERINRPEFGAGVRKLVFTQNSEATASLAQTLVYQALTNWLGDLIRVEGVTTRANEERLEIDIAHFLLARNERRFLNVEVAL